MDCKNTFMVVRFEGGGLIGIVLMVGGVREREERERGGFRERGGMHSFEFILFYLFIY
ncbi:hypothetical protein HanIR_Chr03g0122661 [Helianthus annuus]|nr:hypothetical protein HanIR_Chr03g0122661 [Helianthus annuus]